VRRCGCIRRAGSGDRRRISVNSENRHLPDRLRGSPAFMPAISGVLCCFVGLLLTVTIRFGLQVRWDWPHAALAAAAFVALFVKGDILWDVLLGTGASQLLLWK
jgi:hypothetical protein